MMATTDEFVVTEDAMRAVLETMTTMNFALTNLSRRLEEAEEALAILARHIEDNDAPTHCS